MKNYIFGWACWCTPLIPYKRSRGWKISWVIASLLYIASSRTVRATWRDHVTTTPPNKRTLFQVKLVFWYFYHKHQYKKHFFCFTFVLFLLIIAKLFLPWEPGGKDFILLPLLSMKSINTQGLFWTTDNVISFYVIENDAAFFIFNPSMWEAEQTFTLSCQPAWFRASSRPAKAT